MNIEVWQLEALWLCLAFLGGLGAKKLNLPPLIGFLVVGFILNSTGLTDPQLGTIIETAADLGVMLLLFTIGLKINVKSLIKPEILVTASAHMVISIIIFGGLVFGVGFLGLSFFPQISMVTALLIGFALSFSSTVFVVKILEEKGELTSYHGKLAIGILVIQDIFAVLFITFADGKLPSIWALALPLILFVIRRLLGILLNKTDHGEMLTVFGFAATFVFGAVTFSLVGLKPDLGALIMGILLTNHPKAPELYDRMMSFKDLLLIAFFLSIGLSGEITLNAIWLTLFLIGFIILKSVLFFALLAKQNMRARSALLAALSLGNYSEFGLIVGVVALNAGLISPDILVALALLMSLSFVISAPLNQRAQLIYDKYQPLLNKINGTKECIDSEPVNLKKAEFIVIGLGSIGLPAFRFLKEKYGDKVLGIDYNHDRIANLKKEGCNVEWGDATDLLFWQAIKNSKVDNVLLAMSDYKSNLNSILEIDRIQNKNFKLGVIYTYEDELNELNSPNIDFLYSARSNVGADFAYEFITKIGKPDNIAKLA
ncbi:MAG: cation:proton antiporter domain-containing protein [Luteibaculaceae bacterium]